MRIGLVALSLSALLSGGAAAAQTPPAVEWERQAEILAFRGAPLVLEEVEKLPPSGELKVVVEGGPAGSMLVSDVLDHMRQGKRVRMLDFKSPSPTCEVDFSEIDAEQKASDERKRLMDRRGELVPLQHQYEQEMYYEERRTQILEKACGKRPGNPASPPVDMRQKACAIVAKDCKPRKHW